MWSINIILSSKFGGSFKYHIYSRYMLKERDGHPRTRGFRKAKNSVICMPWTTNISALLTDVAVRGKCEQVKYKQLYWNEFSRYSDWLTCGRPGGRSFSPGGGWEFSLPHIVHAGSGARPVCYPMRIRGTFPEGKAAGTWNSLLTSN